MSDLMIVDESLRNPSVIYKSFVRMYCYKIITFIKLLCISNETKKIMKMARFGKLEFKKYLHHILFSLTFENKFLPSAFINMLFSS